MFQPASENAYNAPIVTLKRVPLKPAEKFCYLASVLANDARINKENCISKGQHII